MQGITPITNPDRPGDRRNKHHAVPRSSGSAMLQNDLDDLLLRLSLADDFHLRHGRVHRRKAQ